jgi:biopolymer transport protein ExbB
MLGLLGTVMGLIQIFNVLAGGGIGNPMALSGGIAEALITTISGLAIAVPTMFFHHFSHQKAERIITDLELMAFHLVLFLEVENQ